MDKIKVFETELNYIQTDWVRNLTKEIIARIPDYFFEIPASSTGKYHPEYTTGEGGLVRHVKAACKIANDVMNLEWLSCELEQEVIPCKDFIIAALILHDSCKSGYPNKGKYTKHEHPILATDLIRDALEQLFVEAEVTDWHTTEKVAFYVTHVCLLISAHMGQWNTSNRSSEVLPKPECLEEFLVHMFDYLASRKYITVELDS